MSVRTGLGPIEVALLLTLDDIGARTDRPYIKSARVLHEVDHRSGIAPAYAYRAACDLAASWAAPVPLIDGHGNMGAPGVAPANPRYTELRLTTAGALAVAAERSVAPSVPIGLINGNMYAGGHRPPFRPIAVVRALLALLEDDETDDATLLDICGPPAFPTGCDVSGEVDAVLDGKPGMLRLTARIAVAKEDGRAVLRISNMPPGVDSLTVMNAIAARAEPRPWDKLPPRLAASIGLPITDVNDHSSGDAALVICKLPPGVVPDNVAHRVKSEVWGAHVDVNSALPAPLPLLLRKWITDHATDESAHVLQRLVPL